VHVPFEHAGFAFETLVVHPLAEPQDPLAVQLSTLVPEHVVWPGTHPAALLHVPFVWQVSTPFPEQVVCPGAHEPVHEPPTHAWFTQAVAFCQLPLVLQD
jgi:hypothetical protein